MKLFGYLRSIRKVSEYFPDGCKTGNEFEWMFKGNCPVCIACPIEHLSIFEYRIKYPPHNALTLGDVQINLCDFHLEQLCSEVEKMINSTKDEAFSRCENDS